MNDGRVSGSAVTVFKNLNVSVGGRILLKLVGDLYGTVVRIGMADESADESEEDIGRSGLGSVADTAVRCNEQGRCGAEQEERESTGSGETRHAELLTHR